jgi:hypothetical protein
MPAGLAYLRGLLGNAGRKSGWQLASLPGSAPKMSCNGSCPQPTYTQTQHPPRLTAKLTANPHDNRDPRRTTLDGYTHPELRRSGGR